MPAPIALFVYNRPNHTQQTVLALQKNQLAHDSDLYVFSDGPKSPESAQTVLAVREFIKTIQGFKSVVVVESLVNKGLAQSIIAGVSKVLEKHNEIIVLEDDMVTSSYFLKFMNDGLRTYRDDDQVISIHGYVYPVKKDLPETFFLKGADCWGWATWKRGWNLFEKDGRKLLHEIDKRKQRKEFDFNGTYPFSRMLQKQISGKNDSWAIRWYASAFLLDKLTLYPGRSLVVNIGNDATGTHSWDQIRYHHEQLSSSVAVELIPREENKHAKGVISEFFKRTRPSLFRIFVNKIKFFTR